MYLFLHCINKRDTVPAIKVIMVWWGRKASRDSPPAVRLMGEDVTAIKHRNQNR